MPEPPSPIFTIAAAHASGWTNSALHCAVEGGRLVRPRRGVYAVAAPARTSDPLLAERAAALAYPGLPLSHLSSGRVHGVPLVGRLPGQAQMTTTPRSNADLPGIYVYRARLREHDLVRIDGLLTTSAARAAVDIARHHPLITAVAAIDHILNRRLASAEELRDVFESCRTWPGASRARRALLLSDSRAESPLESISRLTIARLGLRAPELQTTIFDDFDNFIGRCDFYWDEFGVVGEADGRNKYVTADVRTTEKDREERLEDTRLEVARWGWSFVWRDTTSLDRRLRSAFERGTARDDAGQSRRWSAIATPRIAVF